MSRVALAWAQTATATVRTVVTEKKAADAEGRVFTEEVPDAAVLGTFWASSADGKILGMHAGWRERPALIPPKVVKPARIAETTPCARPSRPHRDRMKVPSSGEAAIPRASDEPGLPGR